MLNSFYEVEVSSKDNKVLLYDLNDGAEFYEYRLTDIIRQYFSDREGINKEQIFKVNIAQPIIRSLVEWGENEHGYSRAGISYYARKGKMKERFNIDCEKVGNMYVVIDWGIQ